MDANWLPWALLGASIIIGFVTWSLSRMVVRIDKAHDGIFATEGPVAVLRAEMNTITRRVGGFMTREEAEQRDAERDSEFRHLLQEIRQEAHEREGRLMEALSNHARSTSNETASIKSDVQALSRRIDAVFVQGIRPTHQ